MLNLLFLLLQTATPPRSLDEAAAALAKGDPAAREELLKAGISAILPLRRVRAQAADAVDPLIYELKTHVEDRPAKELLDALEVQHTMDTAGPVGFAVVLDELSRHFSVTFDPGLFRTHWEKTATVKMTARPRRECLESMCRQLGLDYGFLYGTVLIAAPDRLWPAVVPAPRATPLTAEESARAEKLIARLASDDFQEREESQAALKKLGRETIPLLEKGAQGQDAERQARCKALVKVLTEPPAQAVFHRPAAASQKLAGADDALRKQLFGESVSFKVQDIVLDGAMRLMMQPRNIPCQLAPSARTVRLTLDAQNHTAWTLLCIATHFCDHDFLIQDGKIVIDTREEIQRKLAAGR